MNADKSVIHRLYDEGFNRGDEQVFREVYTPDFVHHSKVQHDVPPGAEGERISMLRFREAMPDAHFEVLHLIAEDDWVVARLHATGTPVRDFGTVKATAGVFDIQAAALFRMRDGLIAEEWFFVDGGDGDGG